MSIERYNGDNLARAQGNAEIDHPDQAVRKGGLAQREAPKGTGRVDAHDGEPDDPVDNGLWARRFVDAQGQSQEREDARDSPKANACLSKELQSHVDHIDLGHGDEAMQLGLKLTQVGLSLFERLGGPVVLRLEASVLFALVALLLTSLLGFVFPLIPTVFHLRELAHDVCSRPRWPRAMEWGCGWHPDEPKA